LKHADYEGVASLKACYFAVPLRPATHVEGDT